MTDTLKTPDVAEMTRFLAVEVIKPYILARSPRCHRFSDRALAKWSPDTVPADMLMLIEAMWDRYQLRIVLALENSGCFSATFISKDVSPQFAYKTDIRCVVVEAAFQAVKAMKEKSDG